MKICVALVALLCLWYPAAAQQTLPTLPFSSLTLPAGFSISAYVNQTLPSARSLALATEAPEPATIVYLSTSSSAVYALVDAQSNGTISVVQVVDDSSTPEGIAYYNGSLWTASSAAVTRYDNVDALALAGQSFTDGTVVLGNLPPMSDHGAHYIAIGPDQKLYFNLGTPFNIGIPGPSGIILADGTNVTYGKILRMNLDGSDLEVWLEGIRNVVGMAFQPSTGDFYFSNNGRDDIGNVTYTTSHPDDYIGTAPVQAENFGFPYCDIEGFGPDGLRTVGLQSVIVDPNVTFTPEPNATPQAQFQYCEANTAPVVQPLGPHVATLGLRFYDPEVFSFPSNYTNNTILNAQHGSWDVPSNQKIGYRVMQLVVDDGGNTISYEPFIQGFLTQSTGNVWGRPADVLVLNDGSVLVSDDQVGAVYRVTYQEASSAPPATLATAGRRLLASN